MDDDSISIEISSDKIEFLKNKLQKFELKTILYLNLKERTVNKENILVLFYKKNFKYCEELELKLFELQNRFDDLQFYKVDVENKDFYDVIVQLKITILPHMVYFRGGYLIGTHIGLEKIGDTFVDQFLLEKEIKSKYFLKK